MDREEKLKRHLMDLSRQALSRGMYTCSAFLSPAEQDLLLSVSKELAPVSHTLYGGGEFSERRIAIFGSEADFGYEEAPPVSVLKITPLNEKFGEELSHRDYLGAILNLGIDRSLTGDIIVRGKTAYLYVLDSIRGFIAENLTRVRHTEVRAELVSGDIPELRPVFTPLRLNVASERLDAVITALTGTSRSKAALLFPQQKVSVNGRIVTDASFRLKEGDILSVRGFGKAVYDGIEHETRKGRYYVSIRKYS